MLNPMSSHKALLSATQCHISATSLTAHQRETPRGFKIACDFRQKHMIKAPYSCHFHSYSEYLFAALLESDLDVISYVPQPFLLQVDGKRYTPDFYVTRHSRPPCVIEIKPQKSDVHQSTKVALKRFFHDEIRADFKVISNKAILKKSILAENWVQICRRLHVGRHLTTDSLEAEAQGLALSQSGSTLWDLIKPTDLRGCFEREIAVLRCLHTGRLRTDLTREALHHDMEITA